VAGLTFGPVVERVVNHTGENCLIDLDSGRLTSLPSEVAQGGSSAAIEWAQRQGIDAGGGMQPEIMGLIGFDLIASPRPNDTWDAMTPERLVAIEKGAFSLSKPGNPVFLSARGGVPATWIFKTREGGIGILQIVGFTEGPKGVRIRYKMLQGGAPARAETGVAPASSDAVELTGGEFLKLFEASRQRYQSLVATGETVAYRAEGEEPVYRYRFTWRRAGSRRYVDERKMPTKPTPVPADEWTQTWAFSPEWSKSLKVQPGAYAPRGTITRDPGMRQQVADDILEAMFDMFGYVSKIRPENTSVESKPGGLYTLTVAGVRDAGTRVLVTVDPDKAFVPVESRLVRPNGQPAFVAQFEDYREVGEGLWLPFRHVLVVGPPDKPEEQQTIVTTIMTAQVNKPVAEKDLDFAFPKGTIVSDQIANLRYTVEDVGISVDDGPQSDPLGEALDSLAEESPGVLTVEDITPDEPASDEALEEALGQAQEMGVTQKSRSGSSWARYAVLGVSVLALAALGFVLGKRRVVGHAR